MGLTYRKDKGSALTVTELDDNFRHFTGSHSITGSLIVSSSSPCSIQLGDGSVFKVSNTTGSLHFSGSMGITGSFNISGSGAPVTQTGSQSITGSLNVTGSLWVSGSTIYNYGPFHNYTNNIETFTISGSSVGINSTNPTTHELEIKPASGQVTASMHISGAMSWVRLQNLPTNVTDAAALGTGSLYMSGSVVNRSKALYIFTG